MKVSPLCKVFSLAIIFALIGGYADVTAAPKQSQTERIQIRNNCVSLLYDLLSDEKHVSKLLLIKRDRKELHELIKRISAVSAAGATKLEELAKRDTTLNLKSIALPPGEQATRNAIAKSKEKELLKASGPDFEFNLLVSQAEASNYAAHLAKIAVEHTSDPEQSRELNALSTEMHRLHDEVLSLMRSGLTTAKR